MKRKFIIHQLFAAILVLALSAAFVTPVAAMPGKCRCRKY